MNIVVCVKQVPDTEEEKLKLNESGRVLERAGLASAMNDFDGYALESAARLKDADGSVKIIALTAGPEQAKSVLKSSLSIAADAAYHVCDAGASGSDVFGTAKILSSAIGYIEEQEGCVDAVFCGKQTIDGETGVLGAILSDMLGWPLLTGCLEAVRDGDVLRVRREIKGGEELYHMPLPCVLTFAKPEWPVRYSTIKRKLAANRASIPILDFAALGISAGDAGLNAARTLITSSAEAPKGGKGLIIKEDTPEESAEKLLELLSAAGVV